jgi:HK97 family phage portal protein
MAPLFHNKRKEEALARLREAEALAQAQEALAQAKASEDAAKTQSALARMKLDTILTQYHKEYPVSKNPTVLAIIHAIATTVSTLGLDLFKRENDGDHKMRNHPTAMLMESPNDGDCATQFLYLITCKYLATGNAYILNQDNTALRVLDSSRMRVTRKSEAPYTKIFDYDGKLYTSNEIIHIYNPQYYDETIGHSPIEINREPIELLNDLLLYTKTYFENSAGERNYITLDKDQITGLKDEEVKKEFQRYLEENITNPSSRGRTALLQPGMKIDNIKQTSSVEAELNATITRAKLDVMNLFGMPSYKLTGEYGNSLSTQQVVYYQACILLITEILKEKLQAIIPAKDRPFMYWEFDYSNLLMADIETKHKILREDIRGSLITPNEARKQIGMDVYSGGTDINIGDMIWTLANNRPVLEEYRDLYVQPTTAGNAAAEKNQTDSGATN